MELDIKFAEKFKPNFISSDLKFCANDYNEEDEIEFLVKFWPFSKYKDKILRNIVKDAKLIHRQKIKDVWENHFSNGQCTFDDKLVFEKVWPSIEQEIENFISQKDNSSPVKKIELENSPDFKEINDLKNFYKPLIEKAVKCERGLSLERRIVKLINKEKNFEFRTTYKREIDFGFFKLIGIPDGIDHKRKTVIEIKTKEWIQPESEKERLQCLSYLRMLDFEKCLLVQSDKNGEKKIIEISRDDQEFTDKIYNKLRQFVDKYRTITEDEFLYKILFYCEIKTVPDVLTRFLHND